MEGLVRTIQKNSLEEVRIELTEYHGHHLVGLRIYSNWLQDRKMRPTRKGITVAVELLPAIIEALREAQRRTGN